jgi:hypothetical protein
MSNASLRSSSLAPFNHFTRFHVFLPFIFSSAYLNTATTDGWVHPVRGRSSWQYFAGSRQNIFSRIWGSHGGEYEDGCLLGCSAVKSTNVSEDLAASIIRAILMMMEAARSSETLVNFYQTTQRYSPEDSHLHTFFFAGPHVFLQRHHCSLPHVTQMKVIVFILTCICGYLTILLCIQTDVCLGAVC